MASLAKSIALSARAVNTFCAKEAEFWIFMQSAGKSGRGLRISYNHAMIIKISVQTERGTLMKFSTRDRYALRLMTELADHGGALVPLKEISTAQQISLKYLEQIITPLARAGLVASVRGAQGGYRLARPAEEITAGDILRAVEGELTAIPCLGAQADCPRRDQCRTRAFWYGLNDLINQYVDNITLDRLCAMGNQAINDP